MARRRNRVYRMTPKRRAALKKAQLASARKRSRFSNKQKAAIGVGVGVIGVVAAHKISGSKLSVNSRSNVSKATGMQLPSGVRMTRGKTTTLTVGHGSKKTQIAYTFGRSARSVSSRRRMPQIDRDSIPLYNPKAKVRGWPHVNSDMAKRINQKLREQGGIE